MDNRFTISVVVILFVFIASAVAIEAPKISKDSLKIGWNHDGLSRLNLTQTAFDNWAQGGENNFSWRVDVNIKCIYEKENVNLANAAGLSFGKIKVSSQESRKTVDEIRFQSVFTRKISKYLNPYIAVIAETQLAKGYDYSKPAKEPISDIIDPAYFTQSMGIGYAPKPVFKTRFGAALKETITDKYNKYADDPKTARIEKNKFEVGVESVTNVQKKVNSLVSTSSEMRLFSDLKGYRKVDVRWDNLLTMQIAKFINVNFNFKVYYDRDVDVKRQITQSLAIGLSYDFI
ncbi:DUF3078 domain-containing protein [candidate division KSB1 bacterium]|nr:DUF3078 domain-containing protein [candidate division KSB1 bacterium]